MMEASAATAASVAPAKLGPPRWRRLIPKILLGVFCVSMALSLVAVWMRNQITDTDRYVRTVTPLASDPAIQNAIAAAITTPLDDRLDAFTVTRDTLGDQQRSLAAPIASALVDYVNQTVQSVVTSDQFEQYWVDANRAIHPSVSAMLTGTKGKLLSYQNGQVSVDLAPLFAEVKNRLLERGVDFVDRIQLDPDQTTFVLIDSPDLAKAQRVVHLLETLAIVLPIVALISLGGYLALSLDRRWAVVWSGLGLAVSMAIVLLLLAVARWLYLDRLSPQRDPAAAAAVFDTLLRYLRDAARLLALVGLVVVGVAAIWRRPGHTNQVLGRAGAWLTTTWRRAALRWPWLGSFANRLARHRRGLWVALVAVTCLVLILWDRVTLGVVVAAAVIAAVGFAAIRFLPRTGASGPTTGTSPAEQPTEASREPEPPEIAVRLTATAADVPAVGVQSAVPSSVATARAPVLTISVELPEEDVQLVRRLAIMLRETPREAGSHPGP
jgi:pimeloyl-ACP methyl ester carboxylesterase